MCLFFLRVINPIWDGHWPKNRLLVGWFFIGETWPGTGEVSHTVKGIFPLISKTNNFENVYQNRSY